MIASLQQSLRTLTSTLRAHCHSALGWLLFHLGRDEGARRCFHRVLEIRGEHFPSYVYLSRIACAQGDYSGWRRESEHARRVAPRRYERLRQRLSLPTPHTAGAVMDETGARATWRRSPIAGSGSGLSWESDGGPSGRGTGGVADGGRGTLRDPKAARFGWGRSYFTEGGLGGGSRTGDECGFQDLFGDGFGEGPSAPSASADEWFDRVAPERRSDDVPQDWDAGDELPEADLRPCSRSRRYGDDFSSPRERIRFEQAAPISRAEIESSNLDDLVDRLGSC